MSAQVVKAKRLGDLITELQKIQAEHGSDCEWHGWDDGRLIVEVEPDGVEISLDPEFYDEE